MVCPTLFDWRHYDRLPKFAEYMQGLGLEVFEKILSDINNLEKVVKNDKE
jgi:hypothetical protein